MEHFYGNLKELAEIYDFEKKDANQRCFHHQLNQPWYTKIVLKTNSRTQGSSWVGN